MCTHTTVRLQLVGCLSAFDSYYRYVAAVAIDQVHSNQRNTHTHTNKRTTCSPSTVSKQNHFAECVVAKTGEKMKINKER